MHRISIYILHAVLLFCAFGGGLASYLRLMRASDVGSWPVNSHWVSALAVKRIIVYRIFLHRLLC